MCVFSTENWPNLGNDEREPRLLLITNRKWHTVYAFADNIIIIDFK